jgi:hypothetical protein
MIESAKVLPITETQEIESKALALPEKTEKITGEIAVFVSHKIAVVDNKTMVLADNAVALADDRLDLIEAEFGAFRDAAHKAHKGWTTLISKLSTPVKEFKDYHIAQVKKYKKEIEEAAEAEERRLAEKARQDEEERRLLEAEQAEKEGNHEEAQAIIEEPIYVAPVKVQVETPKVDNRKYTVRPRARVINKLDVIRCVANNPALQDLLDVNITVANQKARAFGKDLGNVIKGLSYYEE